MPGHERHWPPAAAAAAGGMRCWSQTGCSAARPVSVQRPNELLAVTLMKLDNLRYRNITEMSKSSFDRLCDVWMSKRNNGVRVRVISDSVILLHFSSHGQK